MKVGPYEILGNLGAGGSGTVLRARSPDGSEVALKVLRAGAPDVASRLAREVELQRALGSAAGFVALIDAGSSPQGSYLVMPLVRGGTLRQRLRAGPLAVADAVRLGVALGRALGRAHEVGVVHRDLKPENVLFDGEQPLIADLGLAKLVASNDGLSRTGETRGTFGYMPPEQMADAKRAGPAADVFALGAIVYECLAGRAPFEGETALLVLDAVERGRFEPLARARPEVPRALAAVIERALDADPARRFADGGAFARALEARSAPGAARRGRWLAGFALGAVLVAGGALAVLAGRGAAATPPPAHASPPPRSPPPVITSTRLEAAGLLGTPAFRHGAAVTALAAVPGEDAIVAGDATGTVRIWHLPDGAELFADNLFAPGSVRALAAIPGARRFLALGQGGPIDLGLIEPIALKRHAFSEVEPAKILALAAARSAPLYAFLFDRAVRVLDADAKRTVLDIEIGPDDPPLTALAFRTDDELILGDASGKLRPVRLRPKAVLPLLIDVKGPIRALACSPDGRLVAAIDGGSLLYCYDMETKHPARFADRPTRAIVFLPDGRLIAHLDDGALIAIKMSAKESSAKRLGAAKASDAAGFASAGTPQDPFLVVVDGSTGNPALAGSARGAGHEQSVTAILPLAGGRVASAARDGSAYVWELASGKSLAVAEQGAPIPTIRRAPSGEVVTAGLDGTIIVRDPGSLAAIGTRALGTQLTSVAYTDDGNAWGATGDGIVDLSGRPPRARLIPGERVLGLEPAGPTLLLALTTEDLVLLDTKTGAASWRRTRAEGTISYFAPAGPDAVAIALREGDVVLARLADGSPRWSTKLGRTVLCVGASEDGALIAAAPAPARDVVLLAAADGKILARAPLPTTFDAPSTFRFLGDELLVGTNRGLVARFKLKR